MLQSNPIIIMSSSPRAGSTMLQRLLCSSENTMIYGDPVGHEVEFFVNYAASKKLIHERTGFHNNTLRQGIIDGRDDEFIASMVPENALFLNALKDSAMHFLKACETDALHAGRILWGWKIAGINPFVLKTLIQWLPEAKFITLRRELFDVVRSAKAVGIIQCEQGLEHFCKTWSEGNQAFQTLFSQTDNRVLELNYSTLIHHQTATINQLEQFTGASGIKQKIFNKKLNQFNNDSVLTPAELTETELVIIKKYQEICDMKSA